MTDTKEQQRLDAYDKWIKDTNNNPELRCKYCQTKNKCFSYIDLCRVCGYAQNILEIAQGQKYITNKQYESYVEMLKNKDDSITQIVTDLDKKIKFEDIMRYLFEHKIITDKQVKFYNVMFKQNDKKYHDLLKNYDTFIEKENDYNKMRNFYINKHGKAPADFQYKKVWYSIALKDTLPK